MGMFAADTAQKSEAKPASVTQSKQIEEKKQNRNGTTASRLAFLVIPESSSFVKPYSTSFSQSVNQLFVYHGNSYYFRTV